MAEMSVIAHPYARALFSLAKDANQQEIWLNTLDELKQISENKQFLEILDNPQVESKQVIEVVKSLLKNKGISVELNNFLETLAENDRFIILGEIYALFRQLYLDDQKRSDAVIESAYPISLSDKEELEKILSQKFDKTITATIVVKPELLAGVKITINDKVIDGSVKGRLNELATQLTK